MYHCHKAGTDLPVTGNNLIDVHNHCDRGQVPRDQEHGLKCDLRSNIERRRNGPDGNSIRSDLCHPSPLDNRFVHVLYLWLMSCLVFSVYHVVAGVFMEKRFDILAYLGTIVVIWIFSILNFVMAPEARDNYKLARLISLTVIGLITFVISVKLFDKYTNSRTFISAVVQDARKEVQDKFDTFLLCQSLIVFDVQMSVR